jgi:C-terminal processing protease CtpA/Prc
MGKKNRFFSIATLLVLFLVFAFPNIAHGSRGRLTEPDNVLPQNTVIVANPMDARFSRDFSSLLKHLRLKWVVLDGAAIPEFIQDKHLVLLGHPDSPYTGELIQELLTAEEIDTLRSTPDQHVILEKESPWRDDRSIFICSGSDYVLRRNAAEEALRAIIANAPPASDWIQTTYETELDASLRATVDQLQFDWQDNELPLQDLTMDLDARPPRRISAQQAAQDVQRLFYLFSHGYAGYGFFNQDREFEQAKTHILEALSAQASWTPQALSGILYEYLSFIVDCHMTIGEYRFAEHRDFWYDTRLELNPGNEGYQFLSNGKRYTLLSINDADPAAYILPSLNQEGESIYRLGQLSTGKPAPLLLIAANEGQPSQFKIDLRRSNFDYYSEDIFREDLIGGIPVVRARSFSDYYSGELSQFVQTGSNQRGEAVVIVDLRGNGGGNEHWPVTWIRRLTGRRAGAVFAVSELESKTSMAGRANAFNYWYSEQGMEIYRDELEQYASILESFERGDRQPGWTGPVYPGLPLIPNDTTVIVITNGQVASAGEGLVLRISQLENVLVVGENSRGCLTFGNISMHKLPHSGLTVWLPINFGIFPDQVFREGAGLTPDLWVPASQAVDFTVAALRRGTLTTAQALPQATLEERFIPETHWSRVFQMDFGSWLVIASFIIAGAAVAYFNRGKTRLLLGLGVVWSGFGWYWISQNKSPLGNGFLAAGVVYVAWGLYNLWSAYRSREGV